MNVRRAFSFLKALKRNNDRAWFQKKKDVYDEIAQDFSILIDDLLHAMVDEHPEYLDLEPKDCMFRIYRDIRFAKDKSPYKTHLSAFLASGGRKAVQPGYYLHLEPGQSMLAAGWYMPPTEVLGQIRQHIATNGRVLGTLMKRYRGSFNMETFDQLARVPKGFPPDHPMAEWLKQKHFILAVKFTDQEACHKGFERKVIRQMKKLHPFCLFLKAAVK